MNTVQVILCKQHTIDLKLTTSLATETLKLPIVSFGGRSFINRTRVSPFKTLHTQYFIIKNGYIICIQICLILSRELITEITHLTNIINVIYRQIFRIYLVASSFVKLQSISISFVHTVLIIQLINSKFYIINRTVELKLVKSLQSMAKGIDFKFITCLELLF